MKTKFIFSLFCFTMLCFIGFGQNEKAILLKDIPIVYNLDSLETSIKTSNKVNEANYLNSLLSLEWSRFFYSSERYGKNLDELNFLISKKNSATYVPYYNLFSAIANFRNKVNLDSTISLLYSCIPDFEKKKDTLALIITYSRLIDIQMIYKSENFIKSENLLDKLYEKCKILAITSKTNICLLYYYFISIRYCYYWKQDYKKLFLFCEMGLQLLNNDKKLRISQSYFYYYKGVFFRKISNPDSAIDNLKKGIYSLQHPQAGDNINHYVLLIELLIDCKQLDSANVYVKRVEKNLVKRTSNDWYIFYKSKSNLYWTQKKYESAWLFRNKVDSISNLLLEQTYKIPLQELNNKYKTENLILQNEINKKHKTIYKIIASSLLVLFLTVFFVAIYIKRSNKKLMELIQYKTKVQAIISHDLKSPLYGLTQLYEQYNYWTQKNEPQQIEQISKRIDEAAVSMTNLINNILLWTVEIKTKQKTAIHISEIVNNTVQLYENILVANHITVQNNIPANQTIVANANAIQLVFRNWMENVIKHSKPNQIIFYAEQSRTTTKFIVEDNGTISPEILVNIQNLLHHKTDKLIDSYGLGLSLICEFAAKENWQLDVVCQNNKTIFSIEISNLLNQ